MTTALISDIHGNLEALETVLDEIRHRSITQIVCLGDISDPFPQTKAVYERLKSLDIPILRGNHEDYVVDYFQQQKYQGLRHRPISIVADDLGPEIANEFSRLPFDLIMDNAYLCHASPLSNWQSPIDGFTDEMTQAIQKVEQKVIVFGHRHLVWNKALGDQVLHGIGSLGLPNKGSHSAEWAILEGGEIHHQKTDYDYHKTLESYRESGWLEQAAPVSHLLYAELAFSRGLVAKFFLQLPASSKNWSKEEWTIAVDDHLKSQDCWPLPNLD